LGSGCRRTFEELLDAGELAQQLEFQVTAFRREYRKAAYQLRRVI